MKCPKEEENDLSIPKERSKNEGSKCFMKKGITLRGRKKETNFCVPQFKKGEMNELYCPTK